MLEWRPIDDQLPPKDGYYLVACKGGNVTDSYYIPDREEAIRYFTARGTTYYSRKHQGKYSAHFEVSHKSGYEIEYWMEIPSIQIIHLKAKEHLQCVLRHFTSYPVP